MEIYYHGSSALFTQFNLAHALEGDGKVKFGYGVYVTSHYSSAEHYSGVNKAAKQRYVYTVEVPSAEENNHIAFKQPVNPVIVRRAEDKLGEKIPDKHTQDGKDFRKHLAKRLTGKIDLSGEKAASAFLLSIGVEFIEWPYNWRNPALGTNRAILDESKIRIIKTDKVEPKTNFYSIAPFIQMHYPEYYTIETYPADKCACIRKVTDEWGILGNFAPTPMQINSVSFKSCEQLFQLMKFRDAESVKAVYQAPNPKYTAKHWEKTHRREDWGSMIVDVMKFCLSTKYEQSEAFRTTLHRTAGLYIVEDQTTFPKKQADTWGVKLAGSEYIGPNLLGRLLMELRDNGMLEYNLPKDALSFTQILK